jgi:hypothetical protein
MIYKHKYMEGTVYRKMLTLNYVQNRLLGYTARKMIVDRRFRGAYCLHHQYIPEDNSEHHTRRRENLKSHNIKLNHNFKALIIIVQTILS